MLLLITVATSFSSSMISGYKVFSVIVCWWSEVSPSKHIKMYWLLSANILDFPNRQDSEQTLFQNSPSQKNDVFHLDIKNVGGIGQILDYMYTAHLDLNQDNIQNLLDIAQCLQVKSLLNVTFVENVSHRLAIFRLTCVAILVRNHSFVKSAGRGLLPLETSSATLLFTLEKNRTCVTLVVEDLFVGNALQDLEICEDISEHIPGKSLIIGLLQSGPLPPIRSSASAPGSGWNGDPTGTHVAPAQPQNNEGPFSSMALWGLALKTLQNESELDH
ncbi:zinc finger and BTB domain-containing protein 49 [Crotalus adamanteus]|uniref:Zinc finger and BTB domain-containing protein 49 n=1 Tax=Crotalus adamanteus TaxID=8729 RepID=A0AAW1BAX2_CROAD